jgi:hypothetical protein
MLETTYNGEMFAHRLLWQVVEEQSRLATERELEWSKPALVAMVFGFHTVETYLNFIGERLDPETWQNERDFFRNEPYRGWNGKLRKVMELVELPLPEPVERPLKTILELKKLRDLIAHPKSEKLAGKMTHNDGTESPYLASALRSMYTPKEKMTMAVCDVEQFLNQIHKIAKLKVNDDIWFGNEALRGPYQNSVRSTSLSQ